MVVLPALLEPMNPNRSPRFTVRLRELRATMEPKTRERSWVCTAGTSGVELIEESVKGRRFNRYQVAASNIRAGERRRPRAGAGCPCACGGFQID